MKIEDVALVKKRGNKPDGTEILNHIQTRQEKNLQLADVKMTVFFDKHNSVPEYLVMLLFKENEDNDTYMYDGDEWTTQELENQLEDLDSL